MITKRQVRFSELAIVVGSIVRIFNIFQQPPLLALISPFELFC